jgi:hypothetical protein
VKKFINRFLFFLLLTACNLPVAGSPSSVSPTKGTTASVPGVLNNHRIAIRTVNGQAEFFDTVTSAKFTPRGVNYVDFKEFVPGELWEDYIFGAGTYKPDAVRAAFKKLSDSGYNSVRIFFDHCGKGPSCIGNSHGDGLNPVFLDHMVEVMYMADAENLHLLLTANGVPYDGNYWERYDAQLQQDPHGFDQFYGVGYYLHEAGVDMQVEYWDDLMSGLAERSAPFEVMLGWQLQNEYFFSLKESPLTLTSGQVTTVTGNTYDMSIEGQKRQMVTDAVLYWMNALIPVIKKYDPEALVTVGFFAPNFPNKLDPVEEWYRDTASLIDVAPVDFWDFHHYPGLFDIRGTMRKGAENFGMMNYSAKPIIMGEYGVFRYVESDIKKVTLAMQQWMAASCLYGFDGWLVWEYKDRPASDQVWGMESSNDAMLIALAPSGHPDPCAIVPVPDENLAKGKPVTASSSVPENPPSNAVDDTLNHWISGGFPPRWIQVDLGKPSTITDFKLTVWQDPDGDTIHRILVRTPQGDWRTIHEFTGFTKNTELLTFTPEVPLTGVQFVKVETIQSPSWVAWHEIRVFGE